MSCLNTLPIRRLAGALRAVNIANCLLLITAAALGFGSLLGEAAGVQLQAMASTALVSVYVLGFSGLLLCYELRLGAERLYEECGFLFTMGGRCAFLLLTANLAWACGPWWLVAALVTNGNAALHAYLLISHPAYNGQAGHANESAGGHGGKSVNQAAGEVRTLNRKHIMQREPKDELFNNVYLSKYFEDAKIASVMNRLIKLEDSFNELEHVMQLISHDYGIDCAVKWMESAQEQHQDWRQLEVADRTGYIKVEEPELTDVERLLQSWVAPHIVAKLSDRMRKELTALYKPERVTPTAAIYHTLQALFNQRHFF